MRTMQMLGATLVAALAALGWTGCGGGGGTSVGTVEQSVVPCNRGTPAFDVWRADFAPNGRRTLAAGVDTRNGSTASEFRLVVACNGEVVIDTIDGQPCSHTPPSRDGETPECPLANVDLGALAATGRVECFAEIGTTEPLDIGVGRCADPERADYEFRMRIDDAALALDLATDDCRAEESCLAEQFGIDPA